MKTFASHAADGWQPTAISAAESIPGEFRMEHRWGRRRPCRARVCVSAGGGIAGVGRLRDVSMSGAFLVTALPLPMFAQLDVAVVLEDGSRCGEFIGTVVRHAPDGVGIEWAEPVAGSICRELGCGKTCPHADGAE